MRLPLRLFGRFTGDLVEFHASSGPRKNHAFYLRSTLLAVVSIKKKITVQDWIKLQEICSSPGFAYHASRTILLKDRGLEDIRMLISALEATKTLNPITKVQMMPAFDLYSKYCTDKDWKFVEDTVDEVMRKFPVLTTEIGNLLLRGLSSTPSWKTKGELILSHFKEKVDEHMLLTLACGAFEHDDFDFAWSLMERLVPIGNNLHPKVYHAILDCHERQPNIDLIYRLIAFVKEHSYMFTLSAAQRLCDCLERTSNRVVRFTQIEPSGHCSCCERQLQNLPLTDEEHKVLLRAIDEMFDMNNAYDTYEKEEILAFKTFLTRSPQYTAVIDGPNIFFRVLNKNGLQSLRQQVLKQRHKILLICRSHMTKASSFQKIFRNDLAYYVKNRSQDDTFTIYAALFAGPRTLVISNDYYGLYYSKMTGVARILFRRWQLSNQVVGLGKNAINLLFPKFSPFCQSSPDGKSIHIPIVSDKNWQAFAPSGWLCIQNVSAQEKKKASKLWPVREFSLNNLLERNSFKMHANRSKTQNEEESSEATFENISVR